MTYNEAIRFLYGLQMFGARPGLERTFQLAALVGNPHEQLHFIHVAGTNGKGSTCAMLESIYRAAGLRVGLFTSPHLVSFRERIQVNREFIPANEVARLATKLQGLVEKFPADQHPTMFEFVTVMALRYFAAQQCDLVIWETGLGGRLDATNIVTPLASVITNIGLDHQQWLGHTLPEIAAEKAGIIKPGVPAITTATQPEVLQVITQAARHAQAPLNIIPSEAALPIASLSLRGAHQRRNAALTFAVVQTLQPQITVTTANIEAGLRSVHWPGRLQVVNRASQTLLLDGAHNAEGVATLLATLRTDFSQHKPTLILGILADKDWPNMARQLATVGKRILTVPVASSRTVAADELATICRQQQPEAMPCASLGEALEKSAADPFVVITGSLYLVGEALELLGCGTKEASNERALNEWTAVKNQNDNSPDHR